MPFALWLGSKEKEEKREKPSASGERSQIYYLDQILGIKPWLEVCKQENQQCTEQSTWIEANSPDGIQSCIAFPYLLSRQSISPAFSDSRGKEAHLRAYSCATDQGQIERNGALSIPSWPFYSCPKMPQLSQQLPKSLCLANRWRPKQQEQEGIFEQEQQREVAQPC